MANPARIDVTPENTWVAVAIGVTSGRVKIGDTSPEWRYTYRMAGNAAPLDLDETDNGAAMLLMGGLLVIDNSSAIDVYMRSDEASYVVVML